MKKKLTSVLLIIVSVFAAFMLTACNNDGDKTYHNITFSLNYPGAADYQIDKVESGSKAVKPTDPTRTGYTFDGWYKDEDCVEQYNFESVINGDVTVYALWLEEGVVYRTVTIAYGNGSPNSTTKVKDNYRIAEPSDPVRENHDFFGWFSDSEFNDKFVFSTRITQNITLYANWGEIKVFEAEDIDFSEFVGSGYSNSVVGTSAATGAGATFLKASNNCYVQGLYQKTGGNYNTDLEFKIVSSAKIDNAILRLRLSAEFADIVINGNNYQVTVNGAVIDYSNITLLGSKNSEIGGVTSNKCLPFEDFVISTSVKLTEGPNTIILKTNNSVRPSGGGGTMTCTAPMVDCIKISAAKTALSWAPGYPVTGNYGN